MRFGFLQVALPALALAGVLGFAPAAAQAQSKVAVVDTQRAIMETEDGLRAQATLKKLFDSRQRDLDKEQDEVQKEKEDIEKQKGVLSRDALQKRLENWQRRLAQLQARFVDYNKELQQKQGQLTEPIFRKAVEVIGRLARQEGYDLVFEKQAAPYVRSDLDITDRVITNYNQGAPATGETAPVKPGKPGAAGAKPGLAAPATVAPAAPAMGVPAAPKPTPATVAPKAPPAAAAPKTP